MRKGGKTNREQFVRAALRRNEEGVECLRLGVVLFEVGDGKRVKRSAGQFPILGKTALCVSWGLRQAELSRRAGEAAGRLKSRASKGVHGQKRMPARVVQAGSPREGPGSRY
jgi:hypothetical protein